MARVQSSTPGGGVDWQFRCCDGNCGRTYQRPAPLCTHVNYGMESDDPAAAAMHLAYAATSTSLCMCAGVRALQRQHAPAAASAAHDAALAATARWCAISDVCRNMPRTPLREAVEGAADAHRRAAKFATVQELRRARQALDTADLGMVSDAAAALPVLEALHPPHAPTDPEYSPPEEPPDLRRAPPSWGGYANEVRRWGDDPMRVLRRSPRLSAEHVDWWRWEHIRDLDVPSWRVWVNLPLLGGAVPLGH
eukprot:jgi/Tetstr1/453235/TSEL_040251.t1